MWGRREPYPVNAYVPPIHCCLQARGTARLDHYMVTLTGEPCRCMCRSKARMAVRPEPGRLGAYGCEACSPRRKAVPW